ncbi:hypothetical protein NHH03_19345 [Stieleria sp. TO1_6]|uniref:hypothetical protein n=1 Tax=Stieleria tagensis TaxID=2956795 RepID=UPI00209B16A8|nr:hypothetical protein [Stieleria tagensis]MCO8123909.1 hypothetical protein [Stieleria tagensis]
MQRPAFFLFALLSLPLIVGCEGCRQTGPQDSSADDEAPRQAYSTEPAVVFPADQSATFGAVKPGHWMTAEQSIRSNKGDMRGELISRSAVSLRNMDMETSDSIESLDTIRPVVLPKGQMRGFDFRFLCPVPRSVETRRINLASRLLPRSGGVLDTGAQPFTVMRASEYFFVVLTNRPDRFTRFQVADWSRSSEQNLDLAVPDVNYRIVVPKAGELLPLPETMLDMTSTAVVFWDDLSEDALTPLQQSAIADWIRFGGRLVVNGPAASEAIANTLLADLLPLLPTSNIELDGQAASELLTNWSVKTDRSLKKQIQYVQSGNSRIAIDGQLDPNATAVEKTASLVLQRSVGRGHVIQPRFDLTDDWVEGWDSYDSFVNCVVLNRPPRKYSQNQAVDPEDDGYAPEELGLVFTGTKSSADAAVNTQFRLATRDWILAAGTDNDRKVNSPFDSFHRIDAITGLSSWNDNSDTIALLRQTLTSEAGIEIPGSALVIRSLAIYLIVLVPINYIVFRLMNRLEYAWFAVPLIAVLGAIWAARQARLDIGFARSNTELAVLEAHAGYPRAHLTRLVGIYNSLSSRYELQFASVDGIGSTLNNETDPGTTVQPRLRVSFEEGPALADVAVPSNRMRYVHTEEIVDLGGSFFFDGQQTLTSESDLDLTDGLVVRKTVDGETQVALVGGLAAGETKTLDFRSTERLMVATGLPMQTSRLIRRFATPGLIPGGSSRLVARIDGSLKGVQITPTASQHVAQTIAIIHLEHAKLPPPESDFNLVSDFRRVNQLDSETPSDSQ